MILYNLFSRKPLSETNISYTEFLALVDAQQVGEVIMQGQVLFITDATGRRFRIFAPRTAT